MDTLSRHTLSQTAQAPLLRSRNAWILLGVWLILTAPLFIGMPLNTDTALFDVQARTVLEGGVAYRDVVEPNLPGVLWIHLAIRSLAGWSSEAIRAADLMAFAGLLWLWAGAARLQRSSHAAFILAAAFFYLTRNEWCHAQRDVWMLLPAGAAMVVRLRRHHGSPDGTFVLEGLLWGTAFWIKPHIIVPAGVVVLLDSSRRRGASQLRVTGLVVCGGVLAAVPGVLWLMVTGAWVPFCEMMLEWNPEYVAAGRTRMSIDRWLMMSSRFFPWLWIHALAVPIALAVIVRRFRRGADAVSRTRLLTGGCYLGWLFQSVALQHALDYIHVPGILLGLLVVSGHAWQVPLVMRRAAVTSFVLIAALNTPMLRPAALQQWPVVISQGSTVQVRSALGQGNFPEWDHLSEVIRFLRQQQVRDGEVTCMNVYSVHVYRETQTMPSTRYWSVSILQDLFPRRAESIADAVAGSGHRFVVVEETEASLMHSPHPNAWLDQMTTVFESGSYRVLARPADSLQLATVTPVDGTGPPAGDAKTRSANQNAPMRKPRRGF